MKTILFCLISIASIAQSHELSLTDKNSLTRIQSIAPGQSLQLKNVSIGHLGSVTLNLKRFKVFADDAKITIHSDQGTRHEPMPDNVYFVGDIEDLNHSRVFIGFLENGIIEGVIEMADGEKFTLNQQHKNQFQLNEPNTKSLTNADNRFFNPKDYIEIPESEVITQRAQNNQLLGPGIDYQLTVAIETDYEFYQIFNNTSAEANYITGLIGYVSTMYYNQINTFVLVGNISLWTTAADPWTATDSGCALMEVGKYWNDNNGAVDRAITHFMSGKSLGGGIAWLGVLCNSGFNFNISSYNCSLPYPDNSNYGGAYGVSGGLSGSFNPGNPQPVWDIVVTSHEIGHNFDSPHTHCYAGIGGNANPVDECYNGESGCFSGTESLPGPIGQGSGTIMSYCHTLSPGLSNIALNLGNGHPYGVMPERVPNRMRAHVEAVANSQPQCIMPAANDLIFANGFE
jgi:hypothetical protein